MNRTLPRGNAEPGPWRSSRTPYLKAIYEAVGNPKVKRVIGVLASQSGKTELLLNVLGHKLDDDPGPVLFVGASQRQVESISSSRVDPMIRSTPTLAAKQDKGKSRDRVTQKYFAGQRLGFAWAGSPIELSSHPCALVLLDERDRMDSDVGGEGDPVALAEARIATYPDGKIVVTSSPTLEGASPIWTLWESGTQGKWSWPCPHCSMFFVPEYALLKWPEGSTPAQAKKSARLMCPHCEVLIEEREKPKMNAAGAFQYSGDPDSDTASFWVSGLASPWRAWGDAARRWLEAVKSREHEQMQAVFNTVFGELFRIAGEAPPAAKVAECKGPYRFDEVPTHAQGLTAGVDVQMDRLVYVVRAWGHSQTSWLIRHGEVWGDTLHGDVWADLATLLQAEYGAHTVRMAFIDSGFRPDMVYEFARRMPGVMPSKGHDQLSKPVNLVQLEVNDSGKTNRRGVRLAHVDSSYFKAWIHGRIVWPHDQPGAWHLPSDATDDYCQQIVAEQRLVKPNGAVKWIRTNRANHYLDAEVLATAAANLLQVFAIKEPRQPAQDGAGEAIDAHPGQPPAMRHNPAPRQWQGSGGGNWTTGWRR